jgi:hypothetical protein
MPLSYHQKISILAGLISTHQTNTNPAAHRQTARRLLQTYKYEEILAIVKQPAMPYDMVERLLKEQATKIGSF